MHNPTQKRNPTQIYIYNYYKFANNHTIWLYAIPRGGILMQEVSEFGLEHFQKDLHDRIKDMIYNNSDFPEEFKEGATKDLFDWTYDVIYMSAIGEPLENLIELYEEKGIVVTLDDLEGIRSQHREDIVKMKVALQLFADELMERGLSSDEALRFVKDYRVDENVC